ncbi:MAG: hypothetical protein NC184_05565 [Roseburia sp.]|nr:hypothetical protein [Roseburia sp.]
MKAKERLKKIWAWLRREVLNKRMVLWVIIAELIFWSPCIVGIALAITIDPWYWTIPTVYAAFWAGPFTPAIPLQLGLAYGLKKIADAVRRRKNKNTESSNADKTGK